MEPVTHFLTGACIGRAGFNRKTAYATLAAVLAAEAADLDIFWGFAGPVESPQAPSRHHAYVLGGARGRRRGSGRGMAPRSVAGCRARRKSPGPILASKAEKGDSGSSADPLGLALSHRVRRGAQPLASRLDQQLRRAAVLPIQSALVCGQLHVHRRAGDLALLFLALFMPWVLGLADREIGARRNSDFAAAAGPSLRSPECWCWAAGAGRSTPRRWSWSTTRQCRAEPALRVPPSRTP